MIKNKIQLYDPKPVSIPETMNHAAEVSAAIWAGNIIKLRSLDRRTKMKNKIGYFS